MEFAMAIRSPVNRQHRDQRTVGEYAADLMRNGMGSWTFVIAFLCFMALWAATNSVLYFGGQHGKHGFDPYPYILLNLCLSMLAGLQGAILLIAAKRSDRLAEAKADLDFQHNAENLIRTRHIHAHVGAISEHLGIDVPEETVSVDDLVDLPELNHDGTAPPTGPSRAPTTQ
jgi:uncharacterized membrane protein